MIYFIALCELECASLFLWVLIYAVMLSSYSLNCTELPLQKAAVRIYEDVSMLPLSSIASFSSGTEAPVKHIIAGFAQLTFRVMLFKKLFHFILSTSWSAGVVF